MSNKAPVFKPSKANSNRKFNSRELILAMYKSSEWMTYSRKFLAVNTQCYSCGNKSEATDHLVAHKGDVELFWKLDNMIPLCHKCHNYITSKFDYKSIPDFEGKLKFMHTNRLRNGLMFRVKVVPR